MRFLTTEEVCLTSQCYFPLLRFLCLFTLLRLLLCFIKKFLLLLDHLQLFSYLSVLSTVDPLLLAFLVGKGLSQSDFVIAHPEPHFVPLYPVQLDCRFDYLLLESPK